MRFDIYVPFIAIFVVSYATASRSLEARNKEHKVFTNSYCERIDIRCKNGCNSCCKHRKEKCDTESQRDIVLPALSDVNDINKDFDADEHIDLFSKPVQLINGKEITLHKREHLETVRDKLREFRKLFARKHGMDAERANEHESLLFGGDVVLTPDQADVKLRSIQHHRRRRHSRKHKHRRQPRKILAESATKWTNNVVYFTFERKTASNGTFKNLVKKAVQFWYDNTCLSLLEGVPPNTKDFIVIDRVGGCASMQGRVGGPQGLHLGDGCDQFGIIAHEIGHALGLFHEQQRPDREAAVKVNFNNVDPDDAYNFYQCSSPDECIAPMPYDYGSVMHYNAKSFSLNDQYTLMPKNEAYKATIGGRQQGPTFYDVKQVNEWHCKDSCRQQTAKTCKNGGYLNPRNQCAKCNCPDGWEGDDCGSLERGAPNACGGELLATETWQTISSPNYPEYFPASQRCAWFIKAPKGKRVSLEFSGDVFEFVQAPIPLCDWAYVEVRYETDKANTGIKYCGFEVPKEPIMSKDETMLVLLRNWDKNYPSSGFQARFRVQEPECEVTEWSAWTECSVTCGSGSQHRTRTVTGNNALPSCTSVVLSEKRECTQQPCLEGCKPGEWSQWSSCSASCGLGTQDRTRQGGQECTNEELNESRQCNSGECAHAGNTDCQVTPWSEYGSCTVTCGGGQQERTRIKLATEVPGGKPCWEFPLLDKRPCNDRPCDPVTTTTPKAGGPQRASLNGVAQTVILVVLPILLNLIVNCSFV